MEWGGKARKSGGEWLETVESGEWRVGRAVESDEWRVGRAVESDEWRVGRAVESDEWRVEKTVERSGVICRVCRGFLSQSLFIPLIAPAFSPCRSDLRIAIFDSSLPISTAGKNVYGDYSGGESSGEWRVGRVGKAVDLYRLTDWIAKAIVFVHSICESRLSIRVGQMQRRSKMLRLQRMVESTPKDGAIKRMDNERDSLCGFRLRIATFDSGWANAAAE